jgi:hypothetical protein
MQNIRGSELPESLIQNQTCISNTNYMQFKPLQISSFLGGVGLLKALGFGNLTELDQIQICGRGSCEAQKWRKKYKTL